MIVHATGDWTFTVGAEFHVLNNAHSVQAIHGTRVVYVGSLRVDTDNGPTPAEELRARAAVQFDCGEKFTHRSQAFQGDATIHHDADGWHLKGIMCADGTMATCVVDFQNPEDRSWAVSVWKSLKLGRVAA